MQKRSELFFNLIRLPLDFVAVIAGFALAYEVRIKLTGKPVPNPIGGVLFIKLLVVLVPVWILIFALNGLYGQTGQKARFTEIGKIFAAVSAGMMFVILIDFLSAQPIFPAKAVAIYGYAFSFIFVLLGRLVLRAIQRSLYRYGVGSRRVLLVGTGVVAQQLARDMRSPKTGYRLDAIVDAHPDASTRVKGVKLYKTIDQAQSILSDIDEIIYADAVLDQEQGMAIAEYARTHHLAYRFVPSNMGMYATNSTMQVMAGVPLLEVRQTPLEGWGRIIKRVFDVVGASVGVILAAPIFLVAGLAIKITDPGPILYKHKRLSRSGKVVYVYKFRSMLLKYCTGPGYSGKTDAEVLSEDLGKPELVAEFQKAQKLNDDPRVSKVGRFLRKTSLDELPQLLNVLRGDLSLVGPRPIVQDEVEKYGKQAAVFFALKPGLVGLWQISGRSDIDYDERVKLDIFYIENWSLWLDIKILAKATITILSGKGAY